jgi:small subunit ribosomal protein S20
MPHTKSAWKRMKQAEKRKLHNRAVIKKVKAQVRAFLAAVKGSDLTKAAEEMKQAGKLLDRAGTKGYIHANKASRLKSRMAHRLDKAKKAPVKSA